MLSVHITDISKMHTEWTYIAGRLAAMGSRPLILLMLNRWVGNDLASFVAVAFLVVMLGSALSSFDSHRHFYQVFFHAKRNAGSKSIFSIYCGAIIVQIFVVGPVLFSYTYYAFGDPALGVLVAVFFASERLADEVQRFLIFKGKRHEWGSRILAKSILQVVGVGASVALVGPAVDQLVMGFLLLGNLVAYGSKLPWRYLPTQWSVWKRAFIASIEQRLYWVLSMVSTFISYQDRIVVMLFQHSDIAAYTILVSCLSIMQNSIEYFFISMRRKEILQGKILIQNVFVDKYFYTILCLAAVIGSIASILMLYIYENHHIRYTLMLPIVMFTQFSLSVCNVMREIIYWNYSVFRLILLEIGFIFSMVVAASVISGAGAGYEIILIINTCLLFIRMALMVVIVSNFNFSGLFRRL
jgi:hypothetical protein